MVVSIEEQLVAIDKAIVNIEVVQPRLNKFVLLCLVAYISGLEAGIVTCRDIFGFLIFSAFI